ncbi:MAG: ATP-dependent Clp protease adaptor ClpS [Reichenbachiella sp.]|uniref:ATP-dependent Clp protease adaptor ClpS n=1 Tax=Reichenbachiella sp. TaxID=2184521 RepID=UPI003264AD0A
MSWQLEEEELTEVLEKEKEDEGRILVVFNDEVNTFDHVIDTLIKVCKHEREQAEQCTHIIHNNGKCKVKEGAYDFLKPMKEGILDAGISAVIN